jgi:hypothetical protein
MPNLYQFLESKRDNNGRSYQSYDGEKAAESLAQVVGQAFAALDDMDSALVISESSHFIEPENFGEEEGYVLAYVWHISCPPNMYRRFAAPARVDEFTAKVRALRLKDDSIDRFKTVKRGCMNPVAIGEQRFAEPPATCT